MSDVSSTSSQQQWQHNQYHFGILCDDDDITISRRVKEKLEKLDYKISVFQEFVSASGEAKTNKLFPFIDNCSCILWIATHSSVASEGYDKFYREVAHHESIDTKSRKKFVPFIPCCQSSVELPRTIAKDNPLREDDHDMTDIFKEKIAATFQNIKTFCSIPGPPMPAGKEETIQIDLNNININKQCNVSSNDCTMQEILLLLRGFEQRFSSFEKTTSEKLTWLTQKMKCLEVKIDKLPQR
ncbi:unnamed protein product [Clavelina lepadiformis]|uniref:TIR domain-containing protein n=1 Tax=Clavelina lepadiformis TaxID=159417 RepID=A0ABP0GQC1_CLALP